MKFTEDEEPRAWDKYKDGEEENGPWQPFGDRPDCTYRCDKCNFLTFRTEPTGAKPHWCRRCRYTFFDEYFGPGGINEEKWDKRIKNKIELEKD